MRWFRGVGRFGDIAFEGANGEIKIDEAASVRMTAHAGDVTVGRLTGAAEISTQKGDITIAEATGRRWGGGMVQRAGVEPSITANVTHLAGRRRDQEPARYCQQDGCEAEGDG